MKLVGGLCVACSGKSNKLHLVFTRLLSQAKLHDLLLNMPRDNTHAETLKSQRVKLKEKNAKYPPGTASLHVLGSGAYGAPTSLYLFTDQSRYLFNCGEGAQRLAHEHKIKLSRLERIFITYGSWKNLGGLPGVALTLQDVGVPQIVLHGPSVVDRIFPATRRFVILKNLEIKTASCTPKDSYEDNAIKVKYIPLTVPREVRSAPSSPSRNSENVEDNTDYYQHERTNPQKRRQNSNSINESAAKKSLEEDTAMCYVVQLHPKPGALCLEKCVEAGVPPGPLLGRLKAGEDVVLDDGTIVRSAEVTLAHDPGPLFLVIDVPHERFLPCLEKSFLKFQSPQNDDDKPFLVVHFTPSHIMSNPIYANWMESFPIGTRHLLLNDSNRCLGSAAVHRIQHKLNLVEPNIFPLLSDPGFPAEENENCKENIPEKHTKSSQIIIHGRTRTKIGLRPPKDEESMLETEVDGEKYLEEARGMEGLMEEVKVLRAKLSALEVEDPQTQSKGEYPHVVFFGTGSCIPNKTRNTSAILLNIREDCRVMLDCGEGTAGQVIRHYGAEKAAEIFSTLSAIYISHLHADHHIGLIGLLEKRPKTAAPLYLIAPVQIMAWLHLYDKYFERILKTFVLVPNADLRYDGYHLDDRIRDDFHNSLAMEKVETTWVRHCPHSFGVCFTSKDGWKLTYSGDTLPSESLIQLGKDSDLLIHEATMEDELAEEAKLKMHCTTSEAIEVGRRMAAKSIILTHFSQRYAKLPRIHGEDLGENIGVAFDNMKVRFGDLPKLKHLYPALKLLFRGDIEDLEEKSYKRQMKKERAKRSDVML